MEDNIVKDENDKNETLREVNLKSWIKPRTPETSQKTPLFIYISTFFIVIATVLGTGILGVPVKLAKTGFYPFFVTYSICFLMQCLVLFFIVELLQRAKVAQNQAHEDSDEDESLNPITMSDLGSSGVSLEETDQANHENVIQSPRNTSNNIVDLHLLGKLFLPKKATRLFDVAIMVQFFSIIVSYALAGAEAYGHLFSVNYEFLILPFVFLFALVVIFGAQFIQAIISVLTFTKGSVLVLVVFITVIVGNEANSDSVSDFTYVGRPFLISTVALGGAVNLIPVCFTKVSLIRFDLKKFMMSILLAEFVVWILNVIWCFYILKIVPQSGDISLMSAEREGQIATIPLVQIIQQQFPQYNWIATLINVFIVLSITVSFITMSTGMKHVLEGFVRSSQQEYPITTTNFLDRLKYMGPNSKRALLFILSFGIIYVVAQTNPKGFIIVLEYFTSFALNVEIGIFVSFMMGYSRTSKWRQYTIPYELPRWLYKMRYAAMFFFTFAIIYDVATVGAAIFFDYS